MSLLVCISRVIRLKTPILGRAVCDTQELCSRGHERHRIVGFVLYRENLALPRKEKSGAFFGAGAHRQCVFLRWFHGHCSYKHSHNPREALGTLPTPTPPKNDGYFGRCRIFAPNPRPSSLLADRIYVPPTRGGRYGRCLWHVKLNLMI